MIPILPSNPSTISEPIYSLEAQLERLRRFDTYERKTTPEREAKKAAIEEKLKKALTNNTQ